MPRLDTPAFEALAREINLAAGTPPQTWIRRPNHPDGTQAGLTAMVGNYHVEHSAGRYALLQVKNNAGATTDICYATSARELYTYMQGMLNGLRVANERPLEVEMARRGFVDAAVAAALSK